MEQIIYLFNIMFVAKGTEGKKNSGLSKVKQNS